MVIMERPKIGFRVFWKLCSRGLRLGASINMKDDLVTRVFTVKSQGNSSAPILYLRPLPGRVLAQTSEVGLGVVCPSGRIPRLSASEPFLFLFQLIVYFPHQ